MLMQAISSTKFPILSALQAYHKQVEFFQLHQNLVDHPKGLFHEKNVQLKPQFVDLILRNDLCFCKIIRIFMKILFLNQVKCTQILCLGKFLKYFVSFFYSFIKSFKLYFNGFVLSKLKV